MKTAGHFAIDTNQLLQVGTADDGYDNIQLFRADSVLDVQVDVDVTYPDPDTGFAVDPTISARTTDATLSTYNTFDGYAFYVFRNYGAISREERSSGNETDLDGKDLSPALATNTPYHLTFKVTGTNPVVLTSSVTRISDGTVLFTWSASDATANRYSAAGHNGIGAGTKATGLRWDNYVRTTLP